VVASKRAPEQHADDGCGCSTPSDRRFAEVGLDGEGATWHRQSCHSRFGLCGIRRTLAPFREFCLVLLCSPARNHGTNYRRVLGVASNFQQDRRTAC
jgi:hypothetical protein